MIMNAKTAITTTANQNKFCQMFAFFSASSLALFAFSTSVFVAQLHNNPAALIAISTPLTIAEHMKFPPCMIIE